MYNAKNTTQNCSLIWAKILMREDVKQYHDYVLRTEQDIEHWEAGGLSYLNELPTLHQTIETLMDLTFREMDKKCRSMLAVVEKRARECREKILRETGVRN